MRSVNPTDRTRVRSGADSHCPSVTLLMSSRRQRVPENGNSLTRQCEEAPSDSSLTSQRPPSSSTIARKARNPDWRDRQRTVAVPERSMSPPSPNDRLTAQGSCARPDHT